MTCRILPRSCMPGMPQKGIARNPGSVQNLCLRCSFCSVQARSGVQHRVPILFHSTSPIRLFKPIEGQTVPLLPFYLLQRIVSLLIESVLHKHDSSPAYDTASSTFYYLGYPEPVNSAALRSEINTSTISTQVQPSKYRIQQPTSHNSN